MLKFMINPIIFVSSDAVKNIKTGNSLHCWLFQSFIILITSRRIIPGCW